MKQGSCHHIRLCAILFLLASPCSLVAEEAKEKDKKEELPLKPVRKIDFTTDEGTWMSLDVSRETAVLTTPDASWASVRSASATSKPPITRAGIRASSRA